MKEARVKIEDCDLCENCFTGRGYCKQCGSIDCCYWRFCMAEEKGHDEMLEFAENMQGNPRFNNPTP